MNVLIVLQDVGSNWMCCGVMCLLGCRSVWRYDVWLSVATESLCVVERLCVEGIYRGSARGCFIVMYRLNLRFGLVLL